MEDREIQNWLSRKVFITSLADLCVDILMLVDDG